MVAFYGTRGQQCHCLFTRERSHRGSEPKSNLSCRFVFFPFLHGRDATLCDLLKCWLLWETFASIYKDKREQFLRSVHPENIVKSLNNTVYYPVWGFFFFFNVSWSQVTWNILIISSYMMIEITFVAELFLLHYIIWFVWQWPYRENQVIVVYMRNVFAVPTFWMIVLPVEKLEAINLYYWITISWSNGCFSCPTH